MAKSKGMSQNEQGAILSSARRTRSSREKKGRKEVKWGGGGSSKKKGLLRNEQKTGRWGGSCPSSDQKSNAGELVRPSWETRVKARSVPKKKGKGEKSRLAELPPRRGVETDPKFGVFLGGKRANLKMHVKNNSQWTKELAPSPGQRKKREG